MCQGEQLYAVIDSSLDLAEWKSGSRLCSKINLKIETQGQSSKYFLENDGINGSY
jgi:hypothetical protein